MPKDDPKDPSSTGRKRGRRALEAQGRPYWCRSNMDGGFKTETIRGQVAGCGRSPADPDAPGGMWPGMSQLQVNHINKNVLDNDPVNLEWVCAGCHKLIDSQTEKGVSTKAGDEWGYGNNFQGLTPLIINIDEPLSAGVPEWFPGVTITPDEPEETP